MIFACPYCGNEADYVREYTDIEEYQSDTIQDMYYWRVDCICPFCKGEFWLEPIYYPEEYQMADGCEYSVEELRDLYSKAKQKREQAPGISPPQAQQLYGEIFAKYGFPEPSLDIYGVLADKYGLPAPANTDTTPDTYGALADKYGLPTPKNKEQSLLDKYGLTSFGRKLRRKTKNKEI